MSDDDGKHIKVQAYDVARERLRSVVEQERLLLELVEAAGMRALDVPWVYDIPAELTRQGLELDLEEPEGVTGIVVLSTSHVAVHTWPHRGYAVYDVYSCKGFSTEAVCSVIEKRLDTKILQVADLSFSLHLPPLQGLTTAH
jgi:S-adenosylmethionine/arginine decarboxylase-like enzyme